MNPEEVLTQALREARRFIAGMQAGLPTGSGELALERIDAALASLVPAVPSEGLTEPCVHGPRGDDCGHPDCVGVS